MSDLNTPPKETRIDHQREAWPTQSAVYSHHTHPSVHVLHEPLSMSILRYVVLILVSLLHFVLQASEVTMAEMQQQCDTARQSVIALEVSQKVCWPFRIHVDVEWTWSMGSAELLRMVNRDFIHRGLSEAWV